MVFIPQIELTLKTHENLAMLLFKSLNNKNLQDLLIGTMYKYVL